MRLIGLTGGIACGKSTIVRGLNKYSKISGQLLYVIDADDVVHELQKPDSEAVRAIQKVFPSVVETRPILDSDTLSQGPSSKTTQLTLNREALGKIIFSDPNMRQKLNSIMSRRIAWNIIKMLIKAWWTLPADQIVVLDAPLLYETCLFDKIVSEVVVVSCSEQMQVKRLCRRNDLSEEESLHRVKSQIPIAIKKKWAGYVIDTEDTDDASLPNYNIESHPSDDIPDAILLKSRKCIDWINNNVGSWKFPCVLIGVGGAIAMSAVVTAVCMYFGVTSVRHAFVEMSGMVPNTFRQCASFILLFFF